MSMSSKGLCFERLVPRVMCEMMVPLRGWSPEWCVRWCPSKRWDLVEGLYVTGELPLEGIKVALVGFLNSCKSGCPNILMFLISRIIPSNSVISCTQSPCSEIHILNRSWTHLLLPVCLRVLCALHVGLGAPSCSPSVLSPPSSQSDVFKM